MVARVTADAVSGEILDSELARDITRSLEHTPLEGGPRDIQTILIFLSFSFIFFHFLSFIFFHFLSFSFIILSFSFIFFHFLSVSFIFFVFVGCSKNLIFFGHQFRYDFY